MAAERWTNRESAGGEASRAKMYSEVGGVKHETK